MTQVARLMQADSHLDDINRVSVEATLTTILLKIVLEKATFQFKLRKGN